VKYAFMQQHQGQFSVSRMSEVLGLSRSGYYAWQKSPRAMRAIEDARLMEKIRAAYTASGGVYGSPRVWEDLRAEGERCGENRVARLMRVHRIRAIRGYRTPRYRTGKPANVAPNRLAQQFNVTHPDHAWVTDITYIRTNEGWLYLAVVLDLYSRAVIGWSMKPTLARELVLDALLMAVWRRRPKSPVMVHSDQGSQYGSDDWVQFCQAHTLLPSMSRRGNCFDNAVAEAFFSNLKKERVRRQVYGTRDDARADIFDYIEIFYNRTRRHGHIGMVSPYDYEVASQ
jgi:putative transposase